MFSLIKIVMVRLVPKREERYGQLEARVGNTQLHEIRKIPIPNNNRIYAKEEHKNPTESIFDRVYPDIFKRAEETGAIVPGKTPVIEASTGNAGASFAWCAKVLGYNATVITHEDTPKARVQQIESYGARVVFSPAGEYAAGYVRKLEKILAEDKKSKGKISEDPTRMYCLTKIKNGSDAPGFRRLVDEIEAQLGKVDYFICGVGSGTTISSLGRILKTRNSQTKIIAIEPENSAVITSFRKGKIAEVTLLEMLGIGAAGLPPYKLDIDLPVIDEVILVSNDDWRKGYELLKNEGKEVGRSSCAAFRVALNLSEKVHDKNILILFADPSWKYTDRYPYLK